MFAMTRGPSTKPVWAATKESPLAEERNPHEPVADVDSEDGPGVGELFEHHGVHRLVRVGSDVKKQVTEHDPTGGYGQGRRHHRHGAGCRPHAGLAHNGDAVGNRLDSGVGSATEGIGADEELERAEHSEACHGLADTHRNVVAYGGDIGDVATQNTHQEYGVADNERHEDWHENRNRFLYATNVHERE